MFPSSWVSFLPMFPSTFRAPSKYNLYRLFETATIALEVTMQSLGLDEELYRFPILDALVEVFEQWLLLVVWMSEEESLTVNANLPSSAIS